MAGVNTVLDGLYRLRSNLRVMCAGLNKDYYNNSVKSVDEAIQTIRELQSEKDNVCEWEKGYSGYVGYPAYYSKCCTTNSNGLEMQSHIIKDWKYCPYCGRKIKVVE